MFDSTNADADRAELQRIASQLGVHRYMDECDRHLVQRVSVAVVDARCELDALLDLMLALPRAVPRKCTE